MDREKLKAKTALKNKVVGESKTKKQEIITMACGSKKSGSKKPATKKTGKGGK